MEAYNKNGSYHNGNQKRKSKKDKQYNGKRKRTKGQTQTVYRKSKTSNMNPTKIWGELK